MNLSTAVINVYALCYSLYHIFFSLIPFVRLPCNIISFQLFNVLNRRPYRNCTVLEKGCRDPKKQENYLLRFALPQTHHSSEFRNIFCN